MSEVRDVRVRPDTLYVASGWSTLVTDVHGRITGADPQGFYTQNTRVLSRERITVDGREVIPFSTANVGVHAQLSYAEIADGEAMPSQGAYLLVERFIGEGLRTRLSILSYADEPLTMRLCVGVGGDFADIDEAETGRHRQHGEVEASWCADAQELRLTYLHERLDRAVAVQVKSPVPVRYADGTLAFDLTVPARGSGAVELLIEPVFDGRRLAAPPATFAEPEDSAARARVALARELTRLTSSNLDVAAAWRTAVGTWARCRSASRRARPHPWPGCRSTRRSSAATR
jgi:hypothetical protein